MATVWHDEPIKLHMWSQTSTQVWDYIAANTSYPSDIQAPVQVRRLNTQPLPNKPNPDDGPQMDLTRDVQDLDNDQLRKMLEALQMETVRSEGFHHMGHPKAI